MILFDSEIGSIAFPDCFAGLYEAPSDLTGYCVYQQGSLVVREAHPLDTNAICLDITVSRGVSQNEAEHYIKMAVARYLKEFACLKHGRKMGDFKPTLDRWGLHSLLDEKDSISGSVVYSQHFDPMIGYSAFTRGLVLTGQSSSLLRDDLESGAFSCFRYTPLPENVHAADFRGHLYFSRHPRALMVNELVLAESHWIVPHLKDLGNVEVDVHRGRSAKARAPELLGGCRVVLCDGYTLAKEGDERIIISDFPLRTRRAGKDTLLLPLLHPGAAESIALQFLSIDDLDVDDLQCFNDTVGLLEDWLLKVRKADKLFRIIK